VQIGAQRALWFSKSGILHTSKIIPVLHLSPTTLVSHSVADESFPFFGTWALIASSPPVEREAADL
jgi:hypothetical protein